MVSHDRYFLDKLVDHLFIFEGQGKIKDFWGPYSEYKEKQLEEKSSTDKDSSHKSELELSAMVEDTGNSIKKEMQPKKLSYKHKFELEQLDKEIPELEAEKATMEAKLQQSDLPYEELQKASDRISEVVALLEEKEMRWLELDEMRS